MCILGSNHAGVVSIPVVSHRMMLPSQGSKRGSRISFRLGHSLLYVKIPVSASSLVELRG